MKELQKLVEDGITLDNFIKMCMENNIKQGEEVEKITVCLVHEYAGMINKSCKKVVATIKSCPICDRPMCPDCGNHNVSQLSRVTGYIGDVGGWNNAKKQELKDRKWYGLGH
jgi:anaerobic ribonucleoside-triphosphate reductase